MKIIDLTLTYDSNTNGFYKNQKNILENNGWNSSTLNIYSHAGTHMDAPVHFGVSKKSIDEIDLERCIGKAWLIDIPDCKPKQLLEVKDLGNVAGDFKKNDSLVFRTGWSEHINTTKYRNELPRIGAELADWCVKNSVKIIGVEPPSVADVNNLEEVTLIHKILLNGDITIIEGLCNLDKIKEAHFTLYAIPLKIKNCDGSPARAFAIEN